MDFKCKQRHLCAELLEWRTICKRPFKSELIKSELIRSEVKIRTSQSPLYNVRSDATRGGETPDTLLTS
jgi:hypothetical protein